MDISRQIIDAADASAKDSLSTLNSLSNALTSYAMSTNATWPFVTLPQFDIRSTETFETAAGAELFMFAPIVHRDQKADWEKYSVAQQGWIKDDLFYRGLRNVKPGNIPDEIVSFLETSSGDDEDQMFVPLWQLGPVPTNASVVNLDLYSHPSFHRMVDDVMAAKSIVLSEVVSDLGFLLKHVGTLDRARDEHPRSYAVQPVFDGFHPDATVVGFVLAVVSAR